MSEVQKIAEQSWMPAEFEGLDTNTLRENIEGFIETLDLPQKILIKGVLDEEYDLDKRDRSYIDKSDDLFKGFIKLCEIMDEEQVVIVLAALKKNYLGLVEAIEEIKDAVNKI